jgi:hypothetical protein
MKFVIFLLMILSLPVFSYAQQDEEFFNKCLNESKILFPETASWVPISQLKKVSKDFIHINSAELINTIKQNSKVNQGTEYRTPLSERLHESDFAECYIDDVNLDGIPDIIYSGTDPGTEEEITIIWLGDGTRYSLDPKSGKPYKLISLTRSKNYQMCGYRGLGSDMPGAEYKVFGNSVESLFRSCFLWENVFPKTGIKPVKFTALRSELTLRKSPEIDNAINQEESEMCGTPVYGNILSIYSAGAKGRILGAMKDTNGNAWYFVSLSTDSFSARKKTTIKVNVGWVLTDEVKIIN